METKTKKGLAWTGGIIGGLVLLITTIYFVTKKKTDDAPPAGGADGGSSNIDKGKNFLDNFLHQSSSAQELVQQLLDTNTAGSATAGTVFPVMAFQEKTSGETDLVITFTPPRPKVGQISSGDSVRLSGFGNKFDGDYKIFKKIGNSKAGLWLDSSGNIGAIYIKSGKATSNLDYTVSLSSYPNAKVTKL